MNPERYQQSTAVRLAQTWQDGSRCWAFVPNALPRNWRSIRPR
jgi:hypothetical protein